MSAGPALEVAITGASGQVGTLLRGRLDGEARVVPLRRGDDWTAAIGACDAVVHLAGTLQPRRGESYEEANVETARVVADAAAAGECSRIVFLSYVGATADSSNAYLRAKAAAEELLVGSGVPATILRCLHIYGPPEHPGPTAGAFLAGKSGAVAVPGSGRQRIEPLYVGDVVDAVAYAATHDDAPAGKFDLGGPEEMTMDEFVQALNGPQVKIRHLPPAMAKVAARLAPSLTPTLMDLLLADNVSATPAMEVGERFGFTPHRLGDVWAR